jgi:hypothetical protein
MNGLRWDAIWRAGLSVSMFLLPVALVQQWLVDDGSIDDTSLGSLLFFFVYLFLAGVAGFGAGKLAPDRPIPNGAAAAAFAYALVQAVGVVRRVITGDELSSPIVYVYLALLMATCGTLGAMLERRSRSMRRHQQRS